MTLQVGFLGSDGFLIASDRKACAGDFPSMQQTAETRKIVASELNECFCAVAGDQFGLRLARDLLDMLPRGQFNSDYEIVNYLNRAFEPCQHIYSSKPKECPLLIIGFPQKKLAPNVSKLWRVSFEDTCLSCGVALDKAYGGQLSNPAIFWGERYYQQTYPLNKLKYLAAHVILEGNVIRPGLIEGLDLLIAENGKEPRFLDQAELAELREWSMKFNSEITKGFGF